MTHRMDEIHPWLVEKWRSERIKAGKARSTVNRDVAVLRAALAKAVEWGVIETHPLAKVKPLKTDDRAAVRYLSTAEEQALRSALGARESRIRRECASANQWRRERGYDELSTLEGRMFADYLQPMVLLTLNTGPRRGELIGLHWRNVNLTGRTLTIEGPQAKSGKTRHIPLNEEAVRTLETWQSIAGDRGQVFPSADGGRFSNVKRSWT